MRTCNGYLVVGDEYFAVAWKIATDEIDEFLGPNAFEKAVAWTSPGI